MKRLSIILFLTMLTACLLAGSVFALDETYYIEELEMSLTISDIHNVATRQVDDDNPILYSYDVTADELRDYMVRNNTYLMITEPIFYDYDIRLVASDTDGMDFRDFDKDDLTLVQARLEESYKELGYTNLVVTTYERDDALYYFISNTYDHDGKTGYSLEYITSRNGQLLMFSLDSIIPPDKEMKYQFKRIIDYIEYDVLPPKEATSLTPQESVSATATEYYLQKPDISLSVAEGDLVFTKEMEEDSPYLKEIGMDKDELERYLDEMYTDMWIWAADDSYSFMLTTLEDIDLPDLDKADDAELEDIFQFAEEMVLDDNNTILEKDILRGKNGVFLRFLYAEENGEETLEYITLYNKNVIYFTLYALEGKITPNMEDMLSGMISSVKFGSETQTVTPALKDVQHEAEPTTTPETPQTKPTMETEAGLDTPVEEPHSKTVLRIGLLLGFLVAITAGVVIGIAIGRRKKDLNQPKSYEHDNTPWEL